MSQKKTVYELLYLANLNQFTISYWTFIFGLIFNCASEKFRMLDQISSSSAFNANDMELTSEYIF